MANYTYKKRLGMVNERKRPPIVEANGEAWMTHNGTIAIFPDQWEKDGGMKPLPKGHGVQGVTVPEGRMIRV